MSQLVLERDGEMVVAVLGGEVDMSNASEIERAIGAALDHASALAIDLSVVAFFDSSGVRMLDRVVALCERRGIAVRVIAPEGTPARLVLRLTAFPDPLLADTREDASGALERRGA